MKKYRVVFERYHTGTAEVDAENYNEARQQAVEMEGFEVTWDYPIADANIEVVDIDELFSDDDD